MFVLLRLGEGGEARSDPIYVDHDVLWISSDLPTLWDTRSPVDRTATTAG